MPWILGEYSGLVTQATIQTLTDAGTISWDISRGLNASITLGGNRTMANPTGLPTASPNQTVTLKLFIRQDATGSRTLTWGSLFKWPAAITPTLTTNANARDLIEFNWDGTYLVGSFLGQYL